jgi:hypothetical protein
MTYTPYSKQTMKRIITDNTMFDIMNEIQIAENNNIDDLIALYIMKKLFI